MAGEMVFIFPWWLVFALAGVVIGILIWLFSDLRKKNPS